MKKVSSFRFQVSSYRFRVLVAMLTVLAAFNGFAVRFSPDLSKMDENRAEIRKVIADPKASAADRLFARYDDLQWELFTCDDAALPAKRAEMEKFLTSCGETNKSACLKLLVEVIRNRPGVLVKPDEATLWKLADEVTRGDEALRKEYYYWRTTCLSRALSWKGTVDPEKSAEARLKLIEQKAVDPAFKTPPDCDYDRVSCLADMGKFDEAEKLLVRRAGDADAKARRPWLPRLARFYQERSARYYEDPDPATLRKVVEVCDRMIAEEPKRDRESGYLRQAALMKAQTLESLGEHAAAREAADLAVAASKGRVCDFECAKVYASIAYATGEWNESVARLAQFVEKLNAEENYRCAQALNAANRRAEAIPYLERAVQKCRNKYKRDGYDYLYRKLKAEATAK